MRKIWAVSTKSSCPGVHNLQHPAPEVERLEGGRVTGDQAESPGETDLIRCLRSNRPEGEIERWNHGDAWLQTQRLLRRNKP